MSFDVGFDTVGNATVIVHDGAPVLATDPWIVGSAYFGSWGLAHEIPAEQIDAVRRCPYIWVSHGHPDHLSGDSMALLKDKVILVPNHRGSRVFEDLKAQGFNVRVMPDRQWLELTPRVHALCIPDYNQDAILLLDVNGRLVLNFNDAGNRGWGGFVRPLVKQYARSFLQRHAPVPEDRQRLGRAARVAGRGLSRGIRQHPLRAAARLRAVQLHQG